MRGLAGQNHLIISAGGEVRHGAVQQAAAHGGAPGP